MEQSLTRKLLNTIRNWTKWSTIQGVVVLNQPSAQHDAYLKLRERLPQNFRTPGATINKWY